jgi:beta-glucanase (GH16 family)
LLAAVLLLSGMVAVVVWPHESSTMPRGDLPGWKQVFAEDFNTDVPLGSFPGDAYENRWTGYHGFEDTRGGGTYSLTRTLSVHDGVLDIDLHSEDGTTYVAAPVPLVDARWGGQTYGRFSVRFRADPVPGFSTAWLLWPDSNVWDEGEIDFPEGRLDSTFFAANHCLRDPTKLCYQSGGAGRYDRWHVATIEWTPDKVRFLLDGEVVGSSTESPSTPMHWVLQTETAEKGPSPSDAGHVQIDWVTVYTMDDSGGS